MSAIAGSVSLASTSKARGLGFKQSAPMGQRCTAATAVPAQPKKAQRGALKVVAGNTNEGGLFAPIVIVARNIIGTKQFNQIRGKAIALHSQVRDASRPTSPHLFPPRGRHFFPQRLCCLREWIYREKWQKMWQACGPHALLGAARSALLVRADPFLTWRFLRLDRRSSPSSARRSAPTARCARTSSASPRTTAAALGSSRKQLFSQAIGVFRGKNLFSWRAPQIYFSYFLAD